MVRRPARFAAAITLSAGWGFIDGYFTTPWPAGFWLSVICAVMCVAWDEARARGATLDGAVAGCAASLAVLGTQLCLQPVLPGLLARAHRIPSAAAALWPVLSAVGIPAGADAAGNLLLDGSTGVRAIAVTWEMAALPTLLRLVVAVVLLGTPRSMIRNVSLLLGAGAARLAGVIVLVASGARISLAYEPFVTMIMLLPLAFALRAPRRDAASRLRPMEALTFRKVCGALLLGAAGCCLGWSLAHRDAGTPAGGRVLIDESRSDWAWTSLPFDHARYGQRSVYNYRLWRSWIELHHPTRVLDRPPTARDLESADILIVKTPTSPYDDAEVARIERFVREGGGLYLIGDHTNLFGMSAVLNGVAAPYGLAFLYDDTFPLDHEATDVFRPSPSSPHPVLRGITAYPFETSCTLRVPLRGEPLIIGRRLGAEWVDYGQTNFFGNMRLDPQDTFGLFFQAASVAHGRGRVVAFTDSTNFSNFSMLWPGRRELTLNVLDWLNRPSSGNRLLGCRFPPGFGGILCVIGVAALVAGAAALRASGVVAVALAIWLGIGAGWVGLRVSAARTREAFGASAPRAAPETLMYDTSLSAFRLEEASPLFPRGTGPGWGTGGAFNAFFINSARSGVWPAVAGTLEQALSGRAAVLIWPSRTPTEDGMKALSAFLRRGGRLLILDSVLNVDSTTRLIAGSFGIAIEDRLLPLAEPEGRPRVPVLASAQGLASSPGRPVAKTVGARRRVTRGGATVISTDVGAGRLLVVLDAALFSDRSFGGVYTTPNVQQAETYEAQREVLRMLLEPRPGEATR